MQLKLKKMNKLIFLATDKTLIVFVGKIQCDIIILLYRK